MSNSHEDAGIRRLVVLGHNGFIGTRLCAALQARHPGVPLTGLALDAFDLTSSAAAGQLASQLDTSTALVVLAGLKKQLGDTAEIFNKNLAIATTTCSALVAQPVRRVVFYSSAEVYGEQTDDTAMTERSPVRPTSYYGIAKFASEGLFRKAAAAAGASLVIVRPPLVYGPGDPSGSYGPSGFARAAARGETITLWGDGLELRDFLFVDDLVEVTRRLAFSTVQGVVNVVTGQSRSFREVLDSLERITGRPLTVQGRPRSRPSVNQGYCSARLLAVMPDFMVTSLDDGLRALVAAEQMGQ